MAVEAEQIGCGERPTCTAWTINSSRSSSSSSASSGTRSPWSSSLPSSSPGLYLFKSLTLRLRWDIFYSLTFWYVVETMACKKWSVRVVETMACKNWSVRVVENWVNDNYTNLMIRYIFFFWRCYEYNIFIINFK